MIWWGRRRRKKPTDVAAAASPDIDRTIIDLRDAASMFQAAAIQYTRAAQEEGRGDSGAQPKRR